MQVRILPGAYKKRAEKDHQQDCRNEIKPRWRNRQTPESQKLLLNRVQVQVLPGALSRTQTDSLRKLNRTERRLAEPEDGGSIPPRNAC